jgi:thiamine-phosphate pyrophosphorylase
MKSALRGLYFITPESPSGRLERVAAALRGGARVIQYRDKTHNAERRETEAKALCELCRQHGALFIINDDIDLCLSAETDGVHLGEDDASLGLARERLGGNAILGASCYNSLERAQTMVDLGADYIAFGSVYPSSTKPQARRMTLTDLTEARSRLPLPICAIGGINTKNAGELVALGVDMIAVIEAIAESPDPEATARQLAMLFKPDAAVSRVSDVPSH